jgi:hypothetical protein
MKAAWIESGPSLNDDDSFGPKRIVEVEYCKECSLKGFCGDPKLTISYFPDINTAISLRSIEQGLSTCSSANFERYYLTSMPSSPG